MNSVAIFFASVLIFSNMAAAATPASDMIHTAKSVKAIIEKGHSLPAVIDVQTVEQESIPPETCILVVYDRKPNTVCPGEFGQGPYMDKGYAACFNRTTCFG